MIHACERGRRHGCSSSSRTDSTCPSSSCAKRSKPGRFGKLVMGTVRVRWCRTQEYYDQDPWRGTWALDGGVLSQPGQPSHRPSRVDDGRGRERVCARHHGAGQHRSGRHRGGGAAISQRRARRHRGDRRATRPKDLEGSISVLGEGGTVEIGGFAVNKMRTWQFAEPQPRGRGGHARNIRSIRRTSTASATRPTTSTSSTASATTSSSSSTGSRAARAWSSITAIYESIETGREVTCRFKRSHCRLGNARQNGPRLQACGIVDVDLGATSRSSSRPTSTDARSATGASSGRSSRSRRACVIGARTRVQSHAFICELVDDRRGLLHRSRRHVHQRSVRDRRARQGPARPVAIHARSATACRSARTRRYCRCRICDDVVIGAGAVVTRDITAARRLRRQSRAPDAQLGAQAHADSIDMTNRTASAGAVRGSARAVPDDQSRDRRGDRRRHPAVRRSSAVPTCRSSRREFAAAIGLSALRVLRQRNGLAVHRDARARREARRRDHHARAFLDLDHRDDHPGRRQGRVLRHRRRHLHDRPCSRSKRRSRRAPSASSPFTCTASPRTWTRSWRSRRNTNCG